MHSVYKHIFPNGKVYIGITSLNPSRRWGNGFGYRKQIVMFRAICKYGWENIKHEILYDGLTKEEACKKEIELISYYKSNQKEFGYNRDCGGSCPTEEMKRHLREVNLGKHINIQKMVNYLQSIKALEKRPEKQAFKVVRLDIVVEGN